MYNKKNNVDVVFMSSSWGNLNWLVVRLNDLVVSGDESTRPWRCEYSEGSSMCMCMLACSPTFDLQGTRGSACNDLPLYLHPLIGCWAMTSHQQQEPLDSPPGPSISLHIHLQANWFVFQGADLWPLCFLRVQPPSRSGDRLVLHVVTWMGGEKTAGWYHGNHPIPHKTRQHHIQK